MIFPDNYIKEKLAACIVPFEDRNVQPASYDLRLSGEFIKFEEGYIVDPYNPKTYPRHHRKRQKSYIIHPDEFILASTIEDITLPVNIAGMVSGRSSWGRLGIEVHQTAGWIDPGFSGTITLEIKNNSPNDVKLTEGDRIAQIIFMGLMHDVDTPYSGKYSRQSCPELSKLHEDGLL